MVPGKFGFIDEANEKLYMPSCALLNWQCVLLKSGTIRIILIKCLYGH